MKRLVVAFGIVASLAGCATPQQNAALAGAVVGAAVMSSVYTPQPVRPVTCHYVRGGYVGHDVYGRPMFQYHQVCR